MGRVVHFDISAREPGKAVEFYGKVFGWTFQKWDGPMEYWLVMTGDPAKPGIDGGLSQGEPLAQVVNTLDTEDLDATLGKVEENGGKVIQPRGPIPGVGWYAAFEGPDGNRFGLMQDDPQAK
ncbi:MAG: VOC family protein [bacterium]